MAGLALTSAYAGAAACGSSTPTPAQQTSVAAYEAQLLACVANSATRAAADACMAAVRSKADGGNPTDAGGGS